MYKNILKNIKGKKYSDIERDIFLDIDKGNIKIF